MSEEQGLTPYETREILFYKTENGEVRVEILLFPKKLVLCLWIGECNIHRFCSLCVYTMPCIFKKK